MPLSTSWARGMCFLYTWEPWYFTVWKQFRVVSDADLLIKTPHGWRTHTHWPLLQPWECCSSLKLLSRTAPTVWVLCKYWWGYCASEQSTFLICTFQREGRNYLWFNRAFRYPFQITTVVSFSYADFKLKVNENQHTSYFSWGTFALLFRWLRKVSQKKIPLCLTKGAGFLRTAWQQIPASTPLL